MLAASVWVETVGERHVRAVILGEDGARRIDEVLRLDLASLVGVERGGVELDVQWLVPIGRIDARPAAATCRDPGSVRHGGA